MTVSSTNRRNAYVATGGQTIFAYQFRILNQTHIEVFQNNVLQVLTTDYTVSGVGKAAGGNITLVSGATADDTIVLLRGVILKQETDYVENDAFPAQTHEDALDLLFMAMQELEEEVARALRLVPDSPLTDITLPAPIPGDFIRWNPAGDGFDNATALGATGAIYNELGAAVDFRIESDNSTHMFFLDGSADRVGIALGNLLPTDGVLHVQSGSAGSVAADAGADEGVFEGSGDTGLSILSPAANKGSIFFGSPTSSFSGFIQYDHAADALVAGVATLETLRLNTSGVILNELGSVGNDFRVESNLNTNMLFVDAGNNSVHIDNSLLTGAGDGDLVMANGKSLRWINNAGTSSALSGLTLDSSDNFFYNVPAIGGIHVFQFGGTNAFQFRFQNSGTGINFIGESSSDHGAPSANDGVLYTKDNGGRTDLYWRDNTGVRKIDLT